MKCLIKLAIKLLSCPVFVFAALLFTSVFSLAAALIAEVVFGLEPCILCVYQRFPFIIGAILSTAGLILHKKDQIVDILYIVSGLNFLANSAIAFYHSGVELKWWKSFDTACEVPDFSSQNKDQTILENILSAPSVPCDEIPWADPIIGLSMANYNVLLCFGLFAFCIMARIAHYYKP